MVAIAVVATAMPVDAQVTVADSPQAALTLRSGDVLSVRIWREPDLSGEFSIDELGVVTLPLLGERRVTDAPVREVRDRLVEEYRQQLNNPAIEITPLRRVHVLGYVNQPGTYNVDPTTSLAGLIALAGGASAVGDLSKIRIARSGSETEVPASVESTLLTGDVRSGDQVFVGRRGWFERNTTFIISALLSVSSLLISLSR